MSVDATRIATVAAAALLAAVAFGPSGGAAPAPRQIAFQTDRDGNFEIYVMNDDGTKQRDLTNDPGDDMHPTWSPTGDRIAFTSNRGAQWQLFVMNADGSSQQQVAQSSGSDTNPAWSPREEKIAFETNRDGNWEIYLLDLETHEAQNLTQSPNTDDVDASWSPDGKRIVYASGKLGRGGFRLVTIDVRTRTKRPVPVRVREALRPAWSGLKSRIAFTGLSHGNYDVYLVGSSRPLTSAGAEDADPAWSPDEGTIAFTSNRDGNYEIYAMNADGTKQRNLTHDAGDDLDAAWQPQAKGSKAIVRTTAAVRAHACVNTITGDGAANNLVGGGCQDNIKAKGGADKLTGNGAKDWLYGEADPDKLYARDGLCDLRVDGGPGPGDGGRTDPCDPQFGIDSAI